MKNLRRSNGEEIDKIKSFHFSMSIVGYYVQHHVSVSALFFLQNLTMGSCVKNSHIL